MAQQSNFLCLVGVVKIYPAIPQLPVNQPTDIFKQSKMWGQQDENTSLRVLGLQNFLEYRAGIQIQTTQ